MTSTESQMKTFFVRFVKDESGVTAIGTSLQGLFQTIATALAGA